MRFPEYFWVAFGIPVGEGGLLPFRCPPFGWKYNPMLSHRMLEQLIEEAWLVGVLVSIYLDDMLVFCWGGSRTCAHKQGVRWTLCNLGLATRLVWLGMDPDLSLGGR